MNILIISLITASILTADCLNNGLALTPPMGWLSWLRFNCQTDCVHHPDSCISEKLIMDMADRMAQDGYKDAGYEYVNLDDCWLAATRDTQGRLQPDPARFPHGMKWLSDYVHSKGLKLGIYEDYGTKTCAGFPGSLDHVEIDAQTFADWGIDYLKLDACNVEHSTIDIGYPDMSRSLNKTGRPMVFSCSWAFYTQYYEHKKPNYTAQRQFCNTWRVFDDTRGDWDSVQRVINYFDANQDDLIKANGPGGWNDADMLTIGNPGLTVDQAQAQFAMWSIWSSVFLMSNDLRFIAPSFKEILLNKKVISVNQDPMGVMGRLIVNTTYVAIYLKPVTPIKSSTNSTSYAIVFLNRSLSDKAEVQVKSLKHLGLINESGYYVENLFTNYPYGVLFPSSSFSMVLNATSVLMIKATIV